MALILLDRIKQAITSGGTGVITLGAAASGFQSLGAAHNGELMPYTIEEGANWETGTGTYTHTGTSFSRTNFSASSTGSAVNFTTAAVFFVGLNAVVCAPLTTTSGTNTGDETTARIGTLTAGATAKATPADADTFGLADSTASNILRSLTWANLKTAIQNFLSAANKLLPSLTAGSIPFSDGTTLAQDNANLKWDNTNKRLGVGTTSPSARLHTISTAEQLRLGYDASNYLSTTVSATGTTTFNVAGSAPKFFFATGNVGIGASNPEYPLTVIRNIGGAPFFATIVVQPGGMGGDSAVGLESTRLGTTQRWYFGAGSGSSPNTNNFRIVDLTAGNKDVVNIVPGGNVGIGTTSPSVRLHSVSTGEQLRLGYDASNYLSTTVLSTGAATIAATGSGASITFDSRVIHNNPIKLPAYAEASLPSAATFSGSMAYTSDTRRVVVSDGAAWQSAGRSMAEIHAVALSF